MKREMERGEYSGRPSVGAGKPETLRDPIVNLSVGAKADLDAGKEQEFLRGVEQLWDEGLVVIVSRGNQGPARGTVAVPGTSRKVITVGALKTNERIQDISGRGPTKDCVVKPDLLAPGYQILSCRSQFGRRTGYYTVKSGTSMAGRWWPEPRLYI